MSRLSEKVTVWIQKLSLALASILITVCIAEVGLRYIEQVWFDTPFNLTLAEYADHDLGWKGKQVFGDPQTEKFKIFILGDSFTEAGLLKEEEVYYNRLKNYADVELFIYASAGYGTLQEYLALDRYVDAIQPDLVILQVTPNDIINNSKILEEHSYDHNNLLLRPYLKDDVITLDYPSRFGLVRFDLTKQSRLAYRFFNGVDIFMAKLQKQNFFISVDDADGRKKYLPDFIDSGTITQQILHKMRHRIGNAELVLMPAMLTDKLENQLIRGATDNRHWLTKPAEKILALSQQGMDVHEPDKAHWNALGHQIVGDVLAEELIAKKFFPIKTP